MTQSGPGQGQAPASAQPAASQTAFDAWFDAAMASAFQEPGPLFLPSGRARPPQLLSQLISRLAWSGGLLSAPEPPADPPSLFPAAPGARVRSHGVLAVSQQPALRTLGTGAPAPAPAAAALPDSRAASVGSGATGEFSPVRGRTLAIIHTAPASTIAGPTGGARLLHTSGGVMMGSGLVRRRSAPLLLDASAAVTPQHARPLAHTASSNVVGHNDDVSSTFTQGSELLDVVVEMGDADVLAPATAGVRARTRLLTTLPSISTASDTDSEASTVGGDGSAPLTPILSSPGWLGVTSSSGAAGQPAAHNLRYGNADPSDSADDVEVQPLLVQSQPVSCPEQGSQATAEQAVQTSAGLHGGWTRAGGGSGGGNGAMLGAAPWAIDPYTDAHGFPTMQVMSTTSVSSGDESSAADVEMHADVEMQASTSGDPPTPVGGALRRRAPTPLGSAPHDVRGRVASYAVRSASPGAAAGAAAGAGGRPLAAGSLQDVVFDLVDEGARLLGAAHQDSNSGSGAAMDSGGSNSSSSSSSIGHDSRGGVTGVYGYGALLRSPWQQQQPEQPEQQQGVPPRAPNPFVFAHARSAGGLGSRPGSSARLGGDVRSVPAGTAIPMPPAHVLHMGSAWQGASSLSEDGDEEEREEGAPDHEAVMDATVDLQILGVGLRPPSGERRAGAPGAPAQAWPPHSPDASGDEDGDSAPLPPGVLRIRNQRSTPDASRAASPFATQSLGGMPAAAASRGVGVEVVGPVTLPPPPIAAQSPTVAGEAASGTPRRLAELLMRRAQQAGIGGGGRAVAAGTSFDTGRPSWRTPASHSQQARVRQMLSTRTWTSVESQSGDPLEGLEIPAWAARFAPASRPSSSAGGHLRTASPPSSGPMSGWLPPAGPRHPQSEAGGDEGRPPPVRRASSSLSHARTLPYPAVFDLDDTGSIRSRFSQPPPPELLLPLQPEDSAEGGSDVSMAEEGHEDELTPLRGHLEEGSGMAPPLIPTPDVATAPALRRVGSNDSSALSDASTGIDVTVRCSVVAAPAGPAGSNTSAAPCAGTDSPTTASGSNASSSPTRAAFSAALPGASAGTGGLSGLGGPGAAGSQSPGASSGVTGSFMEWQLGDGAAGGSGAGSVSGSAPHPHRPSSLNASGGYVLARTSATTTSGATSRHTNTAAPSPAPGSHAGTSSRRSTRTGDDAMSSVGEWDGEGLRLHLPGLVYPEEEANNGSPQAQPEPLLRAPPPALVRSPRVSRLHRRSLLPDMFRELGADLDATLEALTPLMGAGGADWPSSEATPRAPCAPPPPELPAPAAAVLTSQEALAELWEWARAQGVHPDAGCVADMVTWLLGHAV